MVNLAERDAAALAELYDRHAPRLLAFIARLVRDRTAAEDILQQVFWHLWRQGSSYEPVLSTPAVWLIVIARSRALDHLRQVRRGAAALEGRGQERAAAAGGPNADSDPLGPPALAMLPPEQREAICLAFYRGLTHTQIAENLEVPVGTVKTRIRLGMHKLREVLAAHEEPRT